VGIFLLPSTESAQTAVVPSHAPRDIPCVATIEQLLAAERAVRDLIEREGLEPPDAVEWWEESVALRWNERKVVIVIDCVSSGGTEA